MSAGSGTSGTGRCAGHGTGRGVGHEAGHGAGRGADTDASTPRTPGTASGPHARAAHPGFDPLRSLRASGDPACDVYLTGTVFLDIVFTGMDSAPVLGTESWARGMGSSPGGVANMATALARLGLRTSLAAAFGDDMYGDYCRDALEHGEGIDLALSHTVPGWHSPVTVSMAYDGERTMISHGHEAPAKESATAYDPQAPDCPPPARACVTSLVPGDGDADGGQDWITAAARRGSRIFADVGWDETGRWDLAALRDLPQCEAFLPNAAEAMRYTRTDSPRAAARALGAHVPVAVVTRGADGACAVDARTGETADIPAVPVEALDTTGAGDVFVAGFVTASLAGWPLADRLAFAGLTAALSVQEFGGSLSAPGWAEIAAWWRRVRSLPGYGGSVHGSAHGRSDHGASGYGTYAFLDPVLAGCGSHGAPRRAVPTIGFRSGSRGA